MGRKGGEMGVGGGGLAWGVRGGREWGNGCGGPAGGEARMERGKRGVRYWARGGGLGGDKGWGVGGRERGNGRGGMGREMGGWGG